MTTLSSVISTAKVVSDRLSFLSGLDLLIFEEESRRQTLERRQLHRILANETWIFGEEWALTGDDESLTRVLKKFLTYLGEDVELAGLKPVLRHDGTNPIPDLVLSRAHENDSDRVENLVVELKRPSVILGEAELAQISKYALAVTRDERFNRPGVTWDFWLIGNDVDELADERRKQIGLPPGCIQRTERYRIFVMRWSEILGAAKHRLKFVEKSLQVTATHDDGISYLRKTHSRYLPPVIAFDESDGEAASSRPA